MDYYLSEERSTCYGLYNKEEFIENATYKLNYEPKDYCIVAIDIEHFKLFTRWWGKKAAEVFIAEIAVRLKYYEKLHSVLNGLEFGIQRTYAGIVSFLYECEEIDHEKLFDNLCKYIKFVTPSFTTKQVIEMFEFIYNRCAKKYIYFRPLYDEWVKIK